MFEEEEGPQSFSWSQTIGMLQNGRQREPPPLRRGKAKQALILKSLLVYICLGGGAFYQDSKSQDSSQSGEAAAAEQHAPSSRARLGRTARSSLLKCRIMMTF